MLNYLLVPFVGLPHFGFLRLFQWITFRAAGAAVSAILLTWIVGPGIMRRLRRMRLHQVIREGTPDAHQQKGRTPTMGGLIILGATLTSTILWARLDNKYVLIAYLDGVDGRDRILGRLPGRKQKSPAENTGLVEACGWSGDAGPLSATTCGSSARTCPGRRRRLFPQIHPHVLSRRTRLAHVLFVTFVMTGASNAVNITDGLDGLAAGLTAIAALTFAFYAYVVGRVDASQYLHVYFLRGSGELTVFCAALMGACIGFLWYNTHPAEVFMGDTGSLALGGALAAVSILLKSEFLLLIVGAVFVGEMLSVILQRFVFKYRKRRYDSQYAREHLRLQASAATPSFRVRLG